MAFAVRKRIGLRELRALEPGCVINDSTLIGFAARRQRSSAITFLVRYRTAENRQRWHVIGRFGPLTPDVARDQARQVLAAVAKGSDPAAEKQQLRTATTMADLCDQYLIDAGTGRLLTRRKTPKRLSTLATDLGRIEKHVKPLMGHMKVVAVTTADVERFMHDVTRGKTASRMPTGRKHGLSNVRGGIGTASRTVGLLGGIFAYAVKMGMRSDNPVRGVVRPADGRRDRRLSEEEYALFGVALRQAEVGGVWFPALRAIKLFALTGWRASEVLTLRWDDVSLAKRTAVLAMTKSGRSLRALSLEAVEVLRATPRIGDCVFVFPSSRNAVMTGFRSIWDRVLLPHGMPRDVTPQTLRHSFASVAADLGYSELTIAALLGHTLHSVTAGYIHRADHVILAAADKVGRAVELMMGFTPRKAPL